MFGSKKIQGLQKYIEQLEHRNAELREALVDEGLEHDAECERCAEDMYKFCPHCGRELTTGA